MKTAVDGAGIYVSFPQADRGAAIRGNWIHDVRRNPANPREAGPWSAAGIYLDGVRPYLGCPGYRFERNVVYRTDNPLFFNKWRREGNTWQDNWFQEDAPPKEKLRAIAAEAGLEAAYRQKLPDGPHNRARGSVEPARCFLSIMCPFWQPFYALSPVRSASRRLFSLSSSSIVSRRCRAAASRPRMHVRQPSTARPTVGLSNCPPTTAWRNEAMFLTAPAV